MKYDKIKPYIEKGLISEQTYPENENVRILREHDELRRMEKRVRK